ncbi:protein TolR [Gammaproteobacteria bacterium]|nr:protein TolR [Gammaproteobacteria bacterium]
MRTRTKKALKHEMNIVPYVDVLFVLLIIFMVTATTISAGLDVDPPETEASESLNLDANPLLVISIDKDGLWYLNLSKIPDQALDHDTLALEAAQIFNADQSLQVAVKGDKNAPLGEVIEAMILLKKITLKNVKIITFPKDES